MSESTERNETKSERKNRLAREKHASMSKIQREDRNERIRVMREIGKWAQ